MKLVYVAGPYRAPSPRGIIENIRRAEALALRVWLAGAACVCPHLNTALFDGAAPDSVWLAGDLEILRRCDAVALVEGWHDSHGAREEVAFARSLGIPVFEVFEELTKWLATPEHERWDEIIEGLERSAAAMRRVQAGEGVSLETAMARIRP